MQTEMIKEKIKELYILIYKNKFKLGELEKSFLWNPAQIIIRDIKKQLHNDDIAKLTNSRKCYESMLYNQQNKNLIYR